MQKESLSECLTEIKFLEELEHLLAKYNAVVAVDFRTTVSGRETYSVGFAVGVHPITTTRNHITSYDVGNIIALERTK